MPVQSYKHNVYGAGDKLFNIPNIDPDTCCRDALLALSNLLSVMQNAINYFIPNTAILAPMIAAMGGKATVSDKVFVRLTWRKENQGVVFKADNLLQKLQIKDIYLRYGMDYTKDPLFK